MSVTTIDPVTTDAHLQDAYRGGRRSIPLPLIAVLGGVVPVIVIATWWVGAEAGWLNPQVFSSPGRVIATLGQLIEDGSLFVHLGVSLSRATGGLLIGLAVGLTAGTVTGLSRIGGALIDPLAQILRTIPVLAILPLFIAWFGLSELPKVLIIAFAVAAPIYVSASQGIRRVDKKLLETARVFDLSTAQTTFQIILPAALPPIFSGLRLGVSLSILLLVAAETINAQSGLGFLANQGLQFFRVDLILAVVIVYGILGLLGNLLVSLIENVSLPWLGKKAVR
jgi:sulfonate transport system permease protein